MTSADSRLSSFLESVRVVEKVALHPSLDERGTAWWTLWKAEMEWTALVNRILPVQTVDPLPPVDERRPIINEVDRAPK